MLRRASQNGGRSSVDATRDSIRVPARFLHPPQQESAGGPRIVGPNMCHGGPDS